MYKKFETGFLFEGETPARQSVSEKIELIRTRSQSFPHKSTRRFKIFTLYTRKEESSMVEKSLLQNVVKKILIAGTESFVVISVKSYSVF